jgi:hypothetical protein
VDEATVAQRFVDEVRGHAATIVNIALPCPLGLSAICPEQRHEHRRQRKLAPIGSSRQIPQVPPAELIWPAFSRMRLPRWPRFPDASPRMLPDTPTATYRAAIRSGQLPVSARRPIIGDLWAGAQHHSNGRIPVSAALSRSAAPSIGFRLTLARFTFSCPLYAWLFAQRRRKSAKTVTTVRTADDLRYRQSSQST